MIEYCVVHLAIFGAMQSNLGADRLVNTLCTVTCIASVDAQTKARASWAHSHAGCRGKGIAKLLGGLLFVGAAGAAALYFKQEMDKRPHTQHEILIIDDDIGETIKTE